MTLSPSLRRPSSLWCRGVTTQGAGRGGDLFKFTPAGFGEEAGDQPGRYQGPGRENQDCPTEVASAGDQHSRHDEADRLTQVLGTGTEGVAEGAQRRREQFGTEAVAGWPRPEDSDIDQSQRGEEG